MSEGIESARVTLSIADNMLILRTISEVVIASYSISRYVIKVGSRGGLVTK